MMNGEYEPEDKYLSKKSRKSKNAPKTYVFNQEEKDNFKKKIEEDA